MKSRVIRNLTEGAIRGALAACALVGLATTAGIIVVLVRDSVPFFRVAPIGEFLTGTDWGPLYNPPHYGVLPLVCGTMLVTVGALVVAVPLAVVVALYLTEFAPRRLAHLIKPVLEILAGIPSIVYGFFAVTFVTPIVLQPLIPSTTTFNAAGAAIVVGMMIIPTVCSMSDDAFRSVPRSLREAGFALSATRCEVATKVVLPAATSGVVAAVLLGLGRAIGETMAVSIAAGLSPSMSINPFRQIQTMTSYIAEISQGEASAGTPEYHCLFAVGLLLFLMTLTTNVVARWFAHRFRERYE